MKLHNSDGSLFLAYKNGDVETYKFLRPKSTVLRPKLRLIDEWNMIENPHEEDVKGNNNVNFYKYIVTSYRSINILETRNLS